MIVSHELAESGFTLFASSDDPPATTAAAPAPESSPKLCEVVVDGLKILRPCQ